MDRDNAPTEEEQFESYKFVLEKMEGKQVVIRTLDIGGEDTSLLTITRRNESILRL